jgi:hypothetical protein
MLHFTVKKLGTLSLCFGSSGGWGGIEVIYRLEKKAKYMETYGALC